MSTSITYVAVCVVCRAPLRWDPWLGMSHSGAFADVNGVEHPRTVMLADLDKLSWLSPRGHCEPQ